MGRVERLGRMGGFLVKGTQFLMSSLRLALVSLPPVLPLLLSSPPLPALLFIPTACVLVCVREWVALLLTAYE